MYNSDSYFSVRSDLNSRIFAALSESLGEDGPLAVILDSEGNWQCSDKSRFDDCFAGVDELRRVASAITDGWDPVGVCIGNCFVIGAQIYRLCGDCEYMFIAVPGYNSDSAIANMGLIEAVLNQALCIVGLVEASVNTVHNSSPGQAKVLGSTAGSTTGCSVLAV